MVKKSVLTLLILLCLLLTATPTAALQPDGHPPAPRGPRKPSLVNAATIAAAIPPPFDCSYNAEINTLLSKTSANDWMGWVRRLSGADPVTVGGRTVTINNRHSYWLFNGKSKAFDYLLEQVRLWYPENQIEQDSYVDAFTGQTWKNLILTIPGSVSPDEVVILSAHFDSTNGSARPNVVPDIAPGADDNASGSAALLEAAMILKDHHFPRTIRLIWFTGEEQGLIGSKEYVRDHSMGNIKGVINLDMFGYDSNNDGCFELHVNSTAYPQSMVASDRVGQCFVQSISEYQLDLTPEYITGNAIGASDHSSFWQQGVGAIEVLENSSFHATPSCPSPDWNPFYHQALDTIDIVNAETGFDITRAALATAFAIASNTDYETYFPFISR